MPKRLKKSEKSSENKLLLEKQKVYKKVFENACKDLIMSNYEKRLTNAGLACIVEPEKYTVSVPFFDEVITFEVPGFSFKSSKQVNITLVTKIMILHYINTASGSPLSGEKITYEDIPGLRGYQPVFEKRAAKPLVVAFGYDRHAFIDAGQGLGAIPEDYGDASFTLYAFPRVPLTFILWEGSEEFPPSVKILFDSSVINYLPLEDITVLAKLASTRILKEARKGLSEGDFI